MLSDLNNSMSPVGYHPALIVENAGYQLDLVLAGFAQLTEEDLRSWLDSAPGLGDSGTAPAPQLVEALLVLESLGAETIAGWLSQLAQAIQENRFDEVYDSLLTQGFNQLEQAFMVFLGTSNSSDARGFFFRLVQDQEIVQPPGGSTQPNYEDRVVIFVLIQAIYVSNYGVGEGISRATNWMTSLDNALSFWGSLLSTLCDGAVCDNPAGDPLENAYKQLRLLISRIIKVVGIEGLAPTIADRFGAFFAWASQGSDPPEVSFGTWQVAINAGAAGWLVLGPVNSSGGLLDPGNANAFMLIRGPKEVTGLNSNILAIVRGDACNICNTPENRQDMISWVTEVVFFLQNTTAESVGGQMGDQRVVVLAFTRKSSDAEQMLRNLDSYQRNLLKAAADQVRAMTDLPIIFMWRSGGTVYYDCTHNCKDKFGHDVSIKLLQALSCAIMGRECVKPQRKNLGLPGTP
jgi:hypothetical protein